MSIDLKEKSQQLLEKVPEKYRPAAIGGAALAGLITVFAGAHAIFGADEPKAQTQIEIVESQPVYGNSLLGIKMQFLSVSDLETCEAAAEAMRNYGQDIVDPQFNGLTIYADCIQTGPDQYGLYLRNGLE